jgi:hypothetical protein
MRAQQSKDSAKREKCGRSTSVCERRECGVRKRRERKAAEAKIKEKGLLLFLSLESACLSGASDLSASSYLKLSSLHLHSAGTTAPIVLDWLFLNITGNGDPRLSLIYLLKYI